MKSNSTVNTGPIIAIITVVFNAAEHLVRTIESIRLLANPNVRFIVIDGASTDGTIDVIKKNEPYIHYWLSEKDNGIYDAFNKGWNAAPADSYILFLGAGDRILRLPETDKLSSSEIVYGNVLLGEKGIFKSKVDLRLRLGNTIHHQALLVKKSVCKDSPFDLRFKTYADFDFNQRLLKSGKKFIFDNSFLGYALPGGVSQSFNVLESLTIVKKNYGAIFALLALFYYLLQFLKNISTSRTRDTT